MTALTLDLRPILRLSQEQFEQIALANPDGLAPLQAKLREYQANGCHLGWLINMQDCQVKVYRADQPPEVLDAPTTLLGEIYLPGLTVDTTEIW
ncbi:MAG: hypothetical protein RLZZ597_3007 [Cyanobacteriota bacterium]|jgi:Uma2 family endonuclease